MGIKSVYKRKEKKMHVKDPVVHVRVRWITETRTTQHAPVGLGSAALAAVVVLPR